MITITGIVRNADTGARSAGIRVTLLDTGFISEDPTGSDGEYVIRIPKGSSLLLHTDDFAAGEDIWFPMINVDYPQVVANEDVEGWPIHCCPHSVVPNPGSVSAWDNYLANCDEATGDLYEATTAAGSGGVLAILFSDTEDGMAKTLPMRLTSSSPDFVIGYCDPTKVFDPAIGGTPGPGPGPCILYPVDYAGSTNCFFSFGKPGTTVRSINISAIDATGQLTIDFPPFQTVPMRPGTITLGLFNAINGEGGKTVLEWAEAVNLFGKSEGGKPE